MILFMENVSKKSEVNKMITCFDGESIGGIYCLLGTQTNYVYNAKGLTIQSSLDFLYNEAKTAEKNYFFSMNYDINKIFESLTEVKNKMLYDKGLIIGCYKVKYYEGKFLTLIKETKVKNKYAGKKYFFDIFGFFNTSFIAVLDILKIDYKRYATELRAGKENRAKFSWEDIDKIIQYNRIEMILLNDIVVKIYNLLPNELKTWRLYGSSSIAKLFLRKFGLWNCAELNDPIFEKAYFGGRIEALKIGKFKNCYYYDINSAYPSVIKDLRFVLNY